MRPRYLLALILGILFLTAAACPVNPGSGARHSHPLNPAPIEISAEGQQVVDLVNVQRVEAGCPELVVNGSFVAFADEQAKFMDNGGGFVHSRLGDPIFAENLSQGFSTPDAVVRAWLDSTVNKDNMLNCSYTDGGAAFAGDFAVMVFGNAS